MQYKNILGQDLPRTGLQSFVVYKVFTKPLLHLSFRIIKSDTGSNSDQVTQELGLPLAYTSQEPWKQCGVGSSGFVTSFRCVISAFYCINYG